MCAMAKDLIAHVRPAGGRPAVRIAIVAAHPDDETIGAGARICEWSDVHIIHVTDGSPDDLTDARRLGLSSRSEYAALRRRERALAMSVARVASSHIHDLSFTDQQVCRHLVILSTTLTGVLTSLEPDVVVTHPYEGGHPDHDSTAFGVHAATRLIARAGRPWPLVLEMTSYHAGAGGLVAGRFLEDDPELDLAAPLPADLLALKRQMLDCYASQRATLDRVKSDAEPLRVAPHYRFGIPPHDGALLYESFNWGIDGPRWRALARDAAWELSLTKELA